MPIKPSCKAVLIPGSVDKGTSLRVITLEGTAVLRHFHMIPQTEIRCCSCSRLLCKIEPDALIGALSIKCHRCKALNILRPTRALPVERDQRPIQHGLLE